MLNLDDYIEPASTAYKFTVAFYELSLNDKFALFDMLYAKGLIRDVEPESETSVYDRFVLGLLQHSPRDLRRDYPVRLERRPSKIARDRDIEELVERLLFTLGTVVILPNG
jgi:hypothetical protein